MHVLVTGGAGYIGSVVATRLLEEGHAVTVLDDLSTGHRDAVPSEAAFVNGRVHDAAALLGGGELGPFDGVVHLAAASLVAESVANPAKYEENNVIGTERLLEAITKAGIGRLVFSSTAAVYGEPDEVPIDEDAPCRPVNPYGESKLAIDRRLSEAAGAEHLAAVSLRYFNVAGAYRGRGERHRTESHLIPLALDAALGRRELAIYGDDYETPDGTCIRDYIHVCDLAEAHIHALEHLLQGGGSDIFNVGTGIGHSVNEVLTAVGKVTGKKVPRTLGPRREGDPPSLVADSEKLQKTLSWRPKRAELDLIVSDAWRFAEQRAK